MWFAAGRKMIDRLIERMRHGGMRDGVPSTAGCHIRANMAWMPDNDRSFSAIEEPNNVAAGLRQQSVYLSIQSL
jgi:hypothetical protein